MNLIDELASLLPPAPPSRDLPRRDQHEADLLAVIAADPASGRLRSSRRRLAGRSWLAPSAAAIVVACAVVIVAVMAVALPELSGSGTRPRSRPAGPPPARHPTAGHPAPGISRPPGGPPGGSPLTVTRHWTVPAGSFARVVVSTDNGPITVTGTGEASAAVTATPSYRGAAPVISYQIAARTLTVQATCPREPHCQVTLQLHVPPGVPVRAATDRGSIRLTGLMSGAAAESQLGDIYLAGISGSVTAQTAQGLISAVLAASRARLTTGQGNVNAVFWVAPELVTASSQLGSVTIRLPSSTSYAVTATADLGGTSVTVPQSPDSRHIVRANSQLGSVTVAG
jgi:hypothetical protein